MALVKSVQIDIGVKGDQDSKAKLDAISARAAKLKESFPEFAVKIDTAAASAKLAIFKGQMKTVADAVTRPLDTSVLTDKAKRQLLGVQVAADKVRAKFPEFKVQIDDRAAKAELAIFAAEAQATADKVGKAFTKAQRPGIVPRIGARVANLVPGVNIGGGAGAAASGAASGGGGISGALSAIGPGGAAGGIAAVAAGLAALPFAAQAAAGGITFALGGALTGIAVLGASKSKEVQKSFDSLKVSAGKDLASIGVPFIGAMQAVIDGAQGLLKFLTPAFRAAAKTISGPFEQFVTTLESAFASGAVTQSLGAVAKAFSAILKAIAPTLPGLVAGIAQGITRIANDIKDNPKAFSDLVTFMVNVAGAGLQVVNALTKVALYVERHFIPAIHDVANVFDGVRHEIAHVWDQIFSNSAGSVIRIAHNVATQFNSLRHGIASTFAGVRHDVAAAWGAIWSNSVGRVQSGISDVVKLFRGLPGRAVSALFGLGHSLAAFASAAISQMWTGFKNTWSAVIHWFTGLPRSILSALGIHSPPHWAIDAGRHIMAGLNIGLGHGLGKLQNFTSGIGKQVVAGLSGGFGGPPGSGPFQAYAKKLLAMRGWADQFGALNYVIMRESGWNPFATNPSSGAYGIPQSLPADKMAAAGSDWRTSGYTQLRWMMGYIASAYGNPFRAAQHEAAFNWYGKGLDAIISRPTLIGVGERGPEHVQVIPRGARSGGTMKVVLEVRANSSSYSRFLADEIRQYVRVSGGGDVQVAYGSGG